MFRFYLDDILLTDQPAGWEDFTIHLERDADNRTLLFKYPNSIMFFGQGYKIINDKRIAQLFCETVVIKVQQACDGGFRTIINGLIFISDCTFNLSQCSVETPIEDDSYSARIFNNKSIEFRPDGDRSKNEIDITPVTPVTIDFFNPTGGAYTYTGVDVFDLKAVFEYAIRFMTDGEIGFVSDWYDALPNEDKIGVTCGRNLRTKDGTPPLLEFGKIFEDIATAYNLFLTIESDITGTYVRIEQESYFFNENENFRIINIEDLKLSFSQDRLFSSVKFGSNEAVKDGSIGTLPYVRFLGFVEEKYTIETVCNIDRTLELTNDGIVDSNIIEDIILNSNDEFDDDYFFINHNPISLQASQYDILGDTGTYYNGTFTNNNVASRYQLLGAIASILGDGQDFFHATRTSTSTGSAAGGGSFPIEPFEFENDCTGINYDTNNNYDGGAVCGGGGLYKYTVPAFADGWYNFRSNILFRILDQCELKIYIQIAYRRYDSGSAFIEQKIFSSDWYINENPSPLIPYSFETVCPFALLSGDFITIKVIAQITHFNVESCSPILEWEFSPGSIFEVINVINGGGIYQPGEPDEYLAALYSFENPIDHEKIESIQDNPVKSFGISETNINIRQTWAKSIKVFPATGKGEWEVLTRIKNTV